MTKQSHCQPSRLNKPTYSNQVNEINETTKPNQPDQAKPSNKKQTRYCKPYRFCAKETILYLGRPESKENHPKNTEGLSPINKHLGFIWILPYFFTCLKIGHFWHLKSRKIPLVPCWDKFNLKTNGQPFVHWALEQNQSPDRPTQALPNASPKCGVAGGGWCKCWACHLFFNVKWCLQTVNNTTTQN